MDIFRTTALIVIALVVFILLMIFIGFFLKVAVVLALLALAYYWFTRAMVNRGGRYRRWR